MEPKQFIEILFPDELQPEDLEFVRLARAAEPGLVRLGQATIGQPCPQAPNSAPVYSRTGAKLGYVASAELAEEPYQYTYWLEACEVAEAAAQILLGKREAVAN
jgi:hypothetical protein